MQYICPMCNTKREIISIKSNSFYKCDGCNNLFYGRDWKKVGLPKKVRHNLYLPENLHDKIKELAESEMRSFNNQCIVLLTEMIEQHIPGRDEKEVKSKNGL